MQTGAYCSQSLQKCYNVSNEQKRRIKHVSIASSVIDSSSNHTIIRQMKLVLVRTHSLFLESHNWDVMVRVCSLIDPCWSALHSPVNGRLWAEWESTGSRKWQQMLCWSCCQQEPWDGDVLVTHFWNKKPHRRPDNERRRLAPNRTLWRSEWRVCASSEMQYPLCSKTPPR